MIENSQVNEVVMRKLQGFVSNFKLQTLKKNEFILRAYEEPQGIYYLKSGNVRMYTISKNGAELVLHIFRPYSFFPLTWAITNSQNVYFYDALSPVEVYRIPKEKVLAFIKSDSDVMYDLITRAYRGIDGLLAKTRYQMIGSAYGKVLSEIFIYVKRFGDISQHVTISEKDLAAQSGLTRETVSREIKILKDKKLITFTKNSLTIVDIGRLEKELAAIA